MFLVAACVALVMTSWLPVTVADEHDAFEASSESAVAALGSGSFETSRRSHGQAKPSEAEAAVNGAHDQPLERIATLLEEIEARRAAEARRGS